MTVGLVRAEWLEDTQPGPSLPLPVFEGVIFPQRWNGFACWATTRAVIEHLDSLHAAHRHAEHLPRFAFDGDTLVFSAPDVAPERIEPFEVDGDGDRLWELSLGMVWTAVTDDEPVPGARLTVYAMDGTVTERTVVKGDDGETVDRDGHLRVAPSALINSSAAQSPPVAGVGL